MDGTADFFRIRFFLPLTKSSSLKCLEQRTACAEGSKFFLLVARIHRSLTSGSDGNLKERQG